jgi:hypothetical protein
MKVASLFSVVLVAVVSTGAAAAIGMEPDSQDAVVITTPLTISAGSNDASATVLVVPASKRLVIRGIYMYKNGGAAGASITLISVGATASGGQKHWASLAIPDTGAPFPAGAISTMFYLAPESLVSIDAHRTGDTSSPQVMEVAISGYYVAER